MQRQLTSAAKMFAKMDAFKAQTQLLSGYYGLIPFGEMSGAGLLSEASDLTGVYF